MESHPASSVSAVLVCQHDDTANTWTRHAAAIVSALATSKLVMWSSDLHSTYTIRMLCAGVVHSDLLVVCTSGDARVAVRDVWGALLNL